MDYTSLLNFQSPELLILSVIGMAAAWYFQNKKSREDRKNLEEQNNKLKQENEGLAASNNTIIYESYKTELQYMKNNQSEMLSKITVLEKQNEELKKQNLDLILKIQELSDKVNKYQENIEKK